MKVNLSFCNNFSAGLEKTLYFFQTIFNLDSNFGDKGLKHTLLSLDISITLSIVIGDPIYKKVMEAYINVIKSDGSNYYWGMEMNKCFIDNGLKDVNSLGIVRVLNGGSEETKFWKASIVENYQKIKSQGILSDEIDETIKNLSDINKWFSGPIIMGTYGKKANIDV